MADHTKGVKSRLPIGAASAHSDIDIFCKSRLFTDAYNHLFRCLFGGSMTDIIQTIRARDPNVPSVASGLSLRGSRLTNCAAIADALASLPRAVPG